MKGVYQHCAKKHLHRYVAEFEFRYTNREATGFNDADRSEAALKGIVGKRITYRRADSPPVPKPLKTIPCQRLIFKFMDSLSES